MRKQLEKPFEYLRMKNGILSPDDKTIVQNWYKARAYVLDKLNEAIEPESNKQMHVVVLGDSPLMLSIVRQVALLAHYVNYDEGNPDEAERKRTIITIVSANKNLVESELQKEEYLCNLTKYCKWTQGGIVCNKDSYIDIELQIVYKWNGAQEKTIEMSENDVKTVLAPKSEDEIFSIDTRKAVLAERMYSLGALIENLPAEDIHCASRYALALDVFQHDLLRKPVTLMVNDKKWKMDLVQVKNSLSNVFCADCFELRKKGIDEYIKTTNEEEKEAWEANNEALSQSEHSRWVVEKLIMGFRPLSEQERLCDEQLFGDAKKQYRKKMKSKLKNPAHIDLCSYADLRRINPEDMKYDSFIMLAIPKILKIVNK